ncbi:MAG: DUF4013 domain-containing protein [Pirellulaceae bacterium]|nr:DUF4013 domain-containing protein [Pirellulaceae bacterium]
MPYATPQESEEFPVFPKPMASAIGSRSVISTTPNLYGFIRWPWHFLRFIYRLGCLCGLLAIAASIPILQWASLGYLLESASRMANGRPWREVVPGLALAGKIGWIAIAISVTWFPAYLSAQYAYQAELIEPGSNLAANWRIAATIIGLAWIVHVVWALIRGGRWRDFLWPAPIRFFREFFRPSTWRRVEDRLWETVTGFHVPRLTWLGFRAWIGGLIWLAIPGMMIVTGMQAKNQPGLAAIGVAGFFLMWWLLLYLPFLQVQFARENSWRALFRISTIRSDFRRAPWAFFFGLLATLGLAVPLFLLRIESPPKELLWLPCLFFVLLTLPAKLCVGWSLNRASRRTQPRWLPSRYLAWILQISIVPFYILFLYLGSIASWDGALIVFLQHAFLTPVPFVGR